MPHGNPSPARAGMRIPGRLGCWAECRDGSAAAALQAVLPQRYRQCCSSATGTAAAAPHALLQQRYRQCCSSATGNAAAALQAMLQQRYRQCCSSATGLGTAMLQPRFGRQRVLWVLGVGAAERWRACGERRGRRAVSSSPPAVLPVLRRADSAQGDDATLATAPATIPSTSATLATVPHKRTADAEETKSSPTGAGDGTADSEATGTGDDPVRPLSQSRGFVPEPT